ncbi:MAG: hypothetical protein ACW964_01765, partial [Candidatus Hodarchaeales archaeon]
MDIISAPEFNESVLISILVNEPSDASGLDKVWLNYTINEWGTFTVIDITSTQSFTFPSEILEYSQIYKWIISFNDTEGNIGTSEENTFSVVDNYAPDLIVPASQTENFPEFNGSVTVEIKINETNDASGIYLIWINY